MIAAYLLDFIGGYIEYVFVPPFIAEWQQRTAERAVRSERAQAYRQLTGDIKTVERKMRSTEAQVGELIEEMGQQETAMCSLRANSQTARQHKKTIMSLYHTNANTVERLRLLVNALARVKSQLVIRQTVIGYITDSMGLRSGPTFDREFREATNVLVESEVDTDAVMSIISQERDTDWADALQAFIRVSGPDPTHLESSRLRPPRVEGESEAALLPPPPPPSPPPQKADWDTTPSAPAIFF